MNISWSEIKDLVLFVSLLINVIVGYIKITERFENKPKLVSKVKFDWPSPDYLRVIIESFCTGQPLTLKEFTCFITPKNFWHSLFKKYYYKKNLYQFSIEVSQQLKPGNLPIKTYLKLLNQLNWTDLYGIKAVDNTGKFWYVEWPSKPEVKKLTSKLILDSISMKSEEREIQVSSYMLGNQYVIVIHFIRDNKSIQYNSIMTKRFHFKSGYEKYLIKLKKDIPRFVSCELERIT